MKRIAVIPGDGIGPEVMAQALPLLEWARGRGHELAWVPFPFGAEHFLATEETLPEAAFQEIRDGFDAILFGAVGDPRVPDNHHAEEILLRLRRELRLGVNRRPCAPLVDALVPLKDVPPAAIRLEVLRENTEGPYCLQGERVPERGTDWAIHTRAAVDTLLGEAFRRARATGMRLTLAHKANVLKHGHGLWMERFQAFRLEFPEVHADAAHADALLCALVQDPRPFGIIAADNFVGDLLSDLLAAFQGGMGLAASISYAPAPPFRCAVLAEPVHGSAPDLAGRGRANPLGMMLSTALLFAHWDWGDEAQAIEAAARAVLESGRATPDLGGRLGSEEMGAAVRALLSSSA